MPQNYALKLGKFFFFLFLLCVVWGSLHEQFITKIDTLISVAQCPNQKNMRLRLLHVSIFSSLGRALDAVRRTPSPCVALGTLLFVTSKFRWIPGWLRKFEVWEPGVLGWATSGPRVVSTLPRQWSSPFRQASLGEGQLKQMARPIMLWHGNYSCVLVVLHAVPGKGKPRLTHNKKVGKGE